MGLALGIDFGTSGARAIAINPDRAIFAQATCTYDRQHPQVWKTSLFSLLEQLPLECRQQITRILINGTSATVLFCDREGEAIAPPLMYNDDRGKAVMPQLQRFAPADHLVLSATSSLAKLFWGLENLSFGDRPIYVLHQADWLASLLHGRLGISDYHNALKLGYDVHNLCYPDWFPKLPATLKLPKIYTPGEAIAPILPDIAQSFSFPSDCLICAGTTDSIAAFIASGASFPGDAVTSLGSTLVLKLLSEIPVNDSCYGIYSHRFGDRYLVGGASNTGGAVLRHFFTDVELDTFSRQINPHQESPLDYYPLLGKGDRFPINDPNLLPRLDPRPDNPVEFLHGLLQAIARIEALGYQRLSELGATPLRRLYTAGGGAKSHTWSQLRQTYLSVPFLTPISPLAAYGSACLALNPI
ncbi:FGGY-family carbohydrate kinase [Roseofilum sp. Belize Diploria]|uniref:FGGY-family carbohydrate kinase n=1 Tax=Roseofilum sp. Belize Diploria TaxID=2821501 RepID=UPI000E8E8DFF|nr:FGGY-family carbohydrate kinase [Roseofilum sp. Belize Diploria]MBP0007073.1 FGGY-family carbohydrate kinase [Roseofilum sp. Belize Diploria]HBR00059.1 carbohydrate kinase [Cyanobacteria bacterium UBA11691]